MWLGYLYFIIHYYVRSYWFIYSIWYQSPNNLCLVDYAIEIYILHNIFFVCACISVYAQIKCAYYTYFCCSGVFMTYRRYFLLPPNLILTFGRVASDAFGPHTFSRPVPWGVTPLRVVPISGDRFRNKKNKILCFFFFFFRAFARQFFSCRRTFFKLAEFFLGCHQFKVAIHIWSCLQCCGVDNEGWWEWRSCRRETMSLGALV